MQYHAGIRTYSGQTPINLMFMGNCSTATTTWCSSEPIYMLKKEESEWPTEVNQHLILSVLKITRYTMAMQLGIADTGILYLNQKESLRTNCREPSAVKSFTFKDNEIIDVEFIWMDDGWSDSLIWKYSGYGAYMYDNIVKWNDGLVQCFVLIVKFWLRPDTGGELITVPGDTLLPHCK